MIKNYTSNTTGTFEKIQKILANHKATRTMFEYDNTGRIDAISFALKVDDKEVGFRLPARVSSVEKLFQKEDRWGYKKALTDAQKEQAYRTAWANIRDWLDAQMALIDTEQVKAEEVFLPYAVQRDGRTYFEHAKENQFLLGDGN